MRLSEEAFRIAARAIDGPMHMMKRELPRIPVMRSSRSLSSSSGVWSGQSLQSATLKWLFVIVLVIFGLAEIPAVLLTSKYLVGAYRANRKR